MFIVDSDIIIDYLNNYEEGANILRKVYGKKLYVSIISWIEIVYGLKKIKNQEKKELALELLLKSAKIEILPIDLKIGNNFIDLKISLKSQQLQDFDLFIAATAISNNLTLLTRNTKHFSRIKNLLLYE